MLWKCERIWAIFDCRVRQAKSVTRIQPLHVSSLVEKYVTFFISKTWRLKCWNFITKAKSKIWMEGTFVQCSNFELLYTLLLKRTVSFAILPFFYLVRSHCFLKAQGNIISESFSNPSLSIQPIIIPPIPSLVIGFPYITSKLFAAGNLNFQT